MHEIKISQLGEGLTEVRVITLFKKEGDVLSKDEPLLEVETDKAVMEIETPCAGYLEKWTVAVGDLVPVGATVALVNQTTSKGKPEPPSAVSQTTVTPVRNKSLSPREKLRRRQEVQAKEEVISPLATTEVQSWEISQRQIRLGQLLLDSHPYIHEAWMSTAVPWDGLSALSRQLRNLQELEYRPTPLELIAWCVVQAMKSHSKFRLLNNSAKGYELQYAASLGISVALPDDELAIAGVSDASTLNLSMFIQSFRSNVSEVQKGRISPGRYPLIISYMAQQGVNMAVPRLVLPSVATLFIGTPFDTPTKAADGTCHWQRFSNFGLTFDHRVINGAGAAAFLKEVAINLEKMKESNIS